MGNKTLPFYIAYIDPDEIATKTPAKRLYSVWPEITATSVSRALGKFWKEVGEEEEWGKKDIVVIGCMPGGLTPQMKKDYVAGETADAVDDEDVEDEDDEDDAEDEIEEEDDEDDEDDES